MKRYLLCLLVFISAGLFAQVQSDADLKAYINSYIKSGGSMIIGDTLNHALIYMVDSKVHIDSVDFDELGNVNTAGKLDNYTIYWDEDSQMWRDTIITLAGGTVTEVGLVAPSNEYVVTGSPINSSGTFQITWKSQTAKKFFAAPNGSSGVPSFRLMLASDLPDLSSTYSITSHTHAAYQQGSDTNSYDATRWWVQQYFSGGGVGQLVGDTNRTTGYDATYFYVDSLFGTMGGGGLYWSDTTGPSPNLATKYYVNSQGFLTSEVDGSTSNELQDLTWDAVNGHVEISSGNDADIGMFATTGTNYGLVPGSNNQTSYFLRGDGTWAAAGGTHPTLYNLSLGSGLTFSAGSGTSLIHTGAATIGIASGYYLPSTTDQTNWGTAYSHSQITTGNPHNLDAGDVGAEPTLTKGNLTESVTGLQFDQTRQVIGGAAALSLTTGYVIPTTTQETNWGTAYTHSTTTGNPHSTDLDDIQNPSTTKTFTMAANDLVFSYTNPVGSDGAFEIQATGAFTGDLLHVHQHTGNVGTTDLAHFEAADADVTPLRVTGSGGSMVVNNLGQVTAAIPNDDVTYTGIMVSESGLMKYRTKSEILSDIAAEPALTKGNLTESVTGLQFDQTRQVIGGAAALSLTSGYVIPTTTQETNWGTAYTHSQVTTGNPHSIAVSDLNVGGTWKVLYSNGTGAWTELDIGADGTYLKSNGVSSIPSWATPGGSGDVSKVGTPLNDQVGVWTGDGTIEGDADLTFNGTKLTATQLYITTPTAGAGDYDKFLVLDVSGTEVKTRTGTEVLSDIGGQAALTTGNLTESVTGLEFDQTRQVIGGAAALSLTTGYIIPTTTQETNWTTGYNHVASDGDLNSSNEIQNVSYTASTRAVAISGGTGFTFPTFATTGTDAGLVNGSNNATSSFLRGDNTWQTVITTEVDGSLSNEGSLTVQTGGSDDSQIQSNTSGSTNVTISAGTNIDITESAPTITIAAEADVVDYTGTQAANNIAYFTENGNTISGEAAFTYDASTNILTADIQKGSQWFDIATTTYSGIIETWTAGTGGISQYDLVYVSGNGTILKCDRDAVGTAKCIGIAVAAISQGSTGYILTRGVIYNSAWAWTAGGTLYNSSTAGEITSTVPATAGYGQKVGTAIDADRVEIQMGSVVGF